MSSSKHTNKVVRNPLLWICIILVTTTTVVSSSGTCLFKRNKAICRGENFQQIPVELLRTEYFATLDMGVNNIIHLENQNLTELEHINYIRRLLLDHNQIEILCHNFFANFSSVEVLDLTGNNIKKIGKEFCGMTNLKELILSNNAIVDIEENSFQCLPNLISIRLANVPIRKLPKMIFNGTKLLNIDLTGTIIENFNQIQFPNTLEIIPTQSPTEYINLTTIKPSLDEDYSQNRINITLVILALLSLILFMGVFICKKYDVCLNRRSLQTPLELISFRSNKEMPNKTNRVSIDSEDAVDAGTETLR